MGKLGAWLAVLWTWLLGLKIGIPGLWLIFLYVLFSLFVVFSLSAFQLQDEIRLYRTADGKTLPVWSVLHLNSEWKTAKRDLDSVTSSIAQLISDNIERRREISNKKKEIILNQQECERAISDFQTKFVPAYTSGQARMDLQSETCNDLYFNIISAATSAPSNRKEEYEKLRDGIKSQLINYRNGNNYINYLNTAISDADAYMKNLQSDKEKKKKQFAKSLRIMAVIPEL